MAQPSTHVDDNAPPPYAEFATPSDHKIATPSAQYNPAHYPPPPEKTRTPSLSGLLQSPSSQRPASVNLGSVSYPPPPPSQPPQTFPAEKQRPVSSNFDNMPHLHSWQSAPPQQKIPADYSGGAPVNLQRTPSQPGLQAQRPGPPPHLFSDPYIAPQHTPMQQTPGLVTPQFQHPPPGSLAVPVYFPPPAAPPTSPSLAPPSIPARPSSAPPVEQQQPVIPQQHAAHTPVYQIPATSSIPLSTVSPPAPQTHYQPHEDEKSNNFGKRFVGNMLVTRLARSGIQTVASTAQLPFYLSPWGDNNPVTLPNVRKRDVAFAGVAHFGVDALAPSAMEVLGGVTKHVAAWTTEAAADHGLQKMGGAKMPSVTRTGTGISTMEVRIRHKLIGEDAVITLAGEREASNYTACTKGWFCPYLYASGRAPRLDRKKDFSVAKFFGPGLKADASLAPTILTCSERASPRLITALCDWHDPSAARPHFGRLAIFFLGISPYRTNSAWSQSRIPNEARLRLHVLEGVPAIVLPIAPRAPTCMWYSKPISVIWEEAQGGSLQIQQDANEVFEGALRDIVDPTGIADPQFQQPGVWESTTLQALTGMFQTIHNVKGASGSLGNVLDPSRTGLVMFRY